MTNRADAAKRLSPLFTWRSAICDSALPPIQRHVALTLSLHMNERGGSCFPTHDQLRAETGLGRSTVIKALGELEGAGWLVRHAGGGRRKGGNGQATEYEATVPEVDGSQTDTVPQGDENRPGGGNNSPGGGHQDAIQDDMEGREQPSVGADAPTPVPPVVLVEGRNLPLDALAAACGISNVENSPRMLQAVVALNGRKGHPEQGIRGIYWAELQRWAAEVEGREDDPEPVKAEARARRLGVLERMAEHPEVFAEYLAKAITRRGALFKERMPGIVFGPAKLRDWFLDLDNIDDDQADDAFDWGDAG